jgi:hypothetical protein
MTRISLTRGMAAIVSDADAKMLARYKWYATPAGGTFYAASAINGKTVYMHRLILDASTGDYVDHANGDGLDNRRENIRLCTQSQNMANSNLSRVSSTSGKRGVYKHGRRWRVVVGGRNNYIGTFSTLEEAVSARNDAAVRLWGEFARIA